MNRRLIKDRVYWMGSIDWDRRLFDSLIPLPDGTSYNWYLIEGSEKTALLDAVEPHMVDDLVAKLPDVEKIDYLISHHAEQDHSGTIPLVLERYPQAKLVVSSKGKGMLLDLLDIPEDRIVVVQDGDTLSLGDKTMKFIYTPWVHWPETMVSYLEEDRILFSCDFFGAHMADSGLFVTDRGRIYEAAKRYYAEIMMPFRNVIHKNLEKISGLNIQMIAPSHGQIYAEPQWIVDAYKDWVAGAPRNAVVLPFVSMHGSTRIMADHLLSALVDRGVRVEPFNLDVTDVGKLAMALVDAATVVVATPTVLGGPHPLVANAVFLANAVKPKAKYLSVIGSYGWGGKTVEMLSAMVPNLKVEVLQPVLCKGVPRKDALEALDRLADTIALKHKENGFQ